MSDINTERRNPFYILLVVVSLAFVVTALAYAVVPVLEEKARDAGSPPPASPIRESLRSDGWVWLLWEGAAVVLLAVLSMGYDRLQRGLQKTPSNITIPPGEPHTPTARGSDADPAV